MRQGTSGLVPARHGSSPTVMVFLLALSTLAGESTLVSKLRGPSITDTMQHAPPMGYYEALIDPHRLADHGEHRSTAAWLAAIWWRTNRNRPGDGDISALANAAQPGYTLERKGLPHQSLRVPNAGDRTGKTERNLPDLGIRFLEHHGLWRK